ncbi:MAG: diphosphate--fructose-6-phosphate 1-phosphotransferase [Opitutales bacterium]|nr:diphosphate--fructose-6-phosphate 1-phosphotransferase [Opitutales bacterium]
MMEAGKELEGNVLVVQSGGISPASNAALAGVISNALNYEAVGEIFGSRDGFCGILNDDLVDLAVQSQQTIRDLLFTPGAALGSFPWTERSEEEFEALLQALERHNIRFLFIIGDAEAQAIALELTQWMQGRYDLRIIALPESNHNTLPLTDHGFGYGSSAKFVASVVSEVSLYTSTVANHDWVNIIELEGNNTEWLIAAALLAHQREEIAAPLLLLPSVPFSAEAFLNRVQSELKSHTACTVVTGATLIDQEGNFIAHSNSSVKLRILLEESLEVHVTVTQLGALQWAAAHNLSQTDIDEAYMCGKKAVDFALDGVTGKMVTLLRAEGSRYSVEYGVADLSNVVSHQKALPEHWFGEDGTLNHNFIKYALPLIQGAVTCAEEDGLPRFAKLKR